MGYHQNPTETRWYGPPLVALGSALWGIETLYRVNLQPHFSSDVLVFYEHVIGVVFLLPLILWNLKKILNMPGRGFVWLCISSFVGSALGTVFFTASLSRMNVSVANVMLNLQPIWSVLIARLLLGERTGPGFERWSALAIIAGCGLSVEGFEAGRFRIENPVGLLFVVGTIICWGTATVAGRALMRDLPLAVAAPMRLVLGTLGTLVIVVLNGNFGTMVAKGPLLLDWEILKGYLQLVLIAGTTPVFFYFFGLKYTSAVAGAFCEMAQTLAAILVTWGIMGHALAPHQVVAAVFLCIAVTRLNVIQARQS